MLQNASIYLNKCLHSSLKISQAIRGRQPRITAGYFKAMYFLLPIVGLSSHFSYWLSPPVLFLWDTPLPSLIPHATPATFLYYFLIFPFQIYLPSFLWPSLCLASLQNLSSEWQPEALCLSFLSVTSGKFTQSPSETFFAQS